MGTYNNNEPIKRFMISIKYHDELFRLKKPIEITFSFEDEVWFAFNEEYEIYANGPTFEDTKKEFYSVLYETYRQFLGYSNDDLAKEAQEIQRKLLELF